MTDGQIPLNAVQGIILLPSGEVREVGAEVLWSSPFYMKEFN